MQVICQTISKFLGDRLKSNCKQGASSAEMNKHLYLLLIKY